MKQCALIKSAQRRGRRFVELIYSETLVFLVWLMLSSCGFHKPGSRSHTEGKNTFKTHTDALLLDHRLWIKKEIWVQFKQR